MRHAAGNAIFTVVIYAVHLEDVAAHRIELFAKGFAVSLEKCVPWTVARLLMKFVITTGAWENVWQKVAVHRAGRFVIINVVIGTGVVAVKAVAHQEYAVNLHLALRVNPAVAAKFVVKMVQIAGLYMVHWNMVASNRKRIK